MKETADLVAFTEEILNGKLHFCALKRKYRLHSFIRHVTIGYYFTHEKTTYYFKNIIIIIRSYE